MLKISKIEFKKFGPYRIIGKEKRISSIGKNPLFAEHEVSIPDLWKNCFSDGTFEELLKLEAYCPEETPNGYEGYISNYEKIDKYFDYLVGFFMKENTPVPNGFDFHDLKQCTIAEIWFEGYEYEILGNTYDIAVDAIKSYGYEIDYDSFHSCEVYTENRYGLPKRNGKKILTLDFYVPCKKK